MPLTEGIPSRLCPGCVRFVAAILKHVRPSNGFAQIGLPYLKKKLKQNWQNDPEQLKAQKQLSVMQEVPPDWIPPFNPQPNGDCTFSH